METSDDSQRDRLTPEVAELHRHLVEVLGGSAPEQELTEPYWTASSELADFFKDVIAHAEEWQAPDAEPAAGKEPAYKKGSKASPPPTRGQQEG